MLKRFVPVLLAVVLIGSFAGCQSRTNDKSSTSSTISGAASSIKEDSSAMEESDSSADASRSEASATSDTERGGLDTFRDTLRDVYGETYYPDTEMTPDQIREELGMDESLYEEVWAENTAEKARPDTFIAVKAKPDKVDEVKEKLVAYKQRLLSDNDFAANTDKIEAAEVYSEGDYVFFVLLGDADEGTSSEGLAEAFGKEIQRGIDAIKEALGSM